jgi:hypothetical protein
MALSPFGQSFCKYKSDKSAKTYQNRSSQPVNNHNLVESMKMGSFNIFQPLQPAQLTSGRMKTWVATCANAGRHAEPEAMAPHYVPQLRRPVPFVDRQKTECSVKNCEVK